MTVTRRAFVAACATAPFVSRARDANAQAPGRNETLVTVQEYGPNSLDMQGIGSAQPVNGVAQNCYDRLIRFKPIPLPDGSGSAYNMAEFEPELAESWQIASDGMSCTFRLREATFHSGRPVTTRDVKWSLDRAVTIGGFATTQMAAGSLEKPEQFVAVDDRTFRVDFVRKDKLTLPNLAVTVPFVFDSELAIRNSGGDPHAKEYLKNNIAGSGGFRVESWKPGVETIYVRNDAWASGKLPQLRRVIQRVVASPATRRALIERGDADLSYGLPPKDFKDLADGGKVKIFSTPVKNALWYVGLNMATGPFTDLRLRQAVAAAMPYEKIIQASFYGRAVGMWGGPAQATAAWPQPFPYTTDIGKAKALAAQAVPNGLRTTLLYDAGEATLTEPMAVLIKEALAPLGIEVELNKVPGANFRGELNKKIHPLAINRFGGWLDFPDYYFFWNLHGNNSIFNISSYQNPAMDKLIDASRFAGDAAEYRRNVEAFIAMAVADIPIIPLVQPFQDVAMQKNIGGFQYWPSREPDFRYFTKG